MFYRNQRDIRHKGFSYWGNGQKYNYRGAKGNFLKHIRACARKYGAIESGKRGAVKTTP